MVASARRWVGLLLATTVLLVLGWAMTATVDEGRQQFAAGSPEWEVAGTARWNTLSLGRRVLLPGALFFLLPEVGVSEVRHEPGHCTEYPPGSFPHLDYVAETRVYTFFRVPVRTFTVRCGGNYL